VLVDFGVAPGVDNLLLGYHDARMQVKDFECLVGGLPKERKPPFEYKAPFSPIDVIEEYTRPARLKVDGRVVTKPALSEIETVAFEGVGALEAFNTDGLRSLLETMPHIPNMREKTLRYPGHAKKIQFLRDAGFFDTEPVHLGDVQISPRQLTANTLIEAWKLSPGEEELTVMRVTIHGILDGREQKIRYDLLDFFDRESGITSMARTTGYACTAAVSLIVEGLWNEPGVSPPELVGRQEPCFTHVVEYLAQRGVKYVKHVSDTIE
jgi:saccharopine dehydrogenase-like NADP-dependent oxidoreductase